MEEISEHLCFRCRTCLVQLKDAGTGYCGAEPIPINGPKAGQLHKWFINCTGIDLYSEQQHIDSPTCHPQQICRECYETLRAANEFRTKVRQVEEKLLCDVKNEMVVSCCICLRQYPKRVTSLTCQVRNAPHLRDWLEWSNAHKLNDKWLNRTVCRFCYSKLRDGYEWRMAAEESREYLDTVMMSTSCQYNMGTASVSDSNQDMSSDFKYIRNTDNNYYNNQFCSLQPAEPTIKQEHFDHQDYDYESACCGNDANNDNNLDNTLFCLDDDFVPNPTNNITNDYMLQNTSSAKKVRNSRVQTSLSTSASLSSSSSSSLKKVCNQCQKRFNKAFLLEAHILQVHQGKTKPFLCKYCTHAYFTHTHLKRHLKTTHKEACLRGIEDNSKFEFLHL